MEEQEEICLHCGDKGFDNALVYCVKCLEVAVHRYCLYVIPKTLDEFVYWVCDECHGKLDKDSMLFKMNAIQCQTRGSEGVGVENNKENDVIVRKEDQIYEGGSRSPHESDAEPHTTEPCVVSYNDSQRSSKKRKTVSSSEANMEDQKKVSVSTEPVSGIEVIDSENCCLDASTVGRMVVSRTDHNENKELVVSESSAKPLQAINFWNYSMNESNTSLMIESPPCPEPVIRPIWRGSFNMQNQKNGILSGLNAHISNKAFHKVYEEACQFQPVLHLEMLPKSDVWPKSFEISEPTSDNIALYFFPSEISARDFDLLLDKMAREKLAMRSFVQNAELLVFPSDLLPLQDCKIQDKLYLWGVFRGKPEPATSPSPLCIEEFGDKLLKHEDIPPNGHMVDGDLANLDSSGSQGPNNYVILKDEASPCEIRDSNESEVETNKTSTVVIRMEEQIFDAPLQQSYDACPQPPCISDVQPSIDEPRVVLVKESERSLKRMKSIGSDEAMFEIQIQETGSTRPQNESEAIVLKQEGEVFRTENQVYKREGGLQQSEDACPQSPCVTDAEPDVLNNARSSKRMKTAGSYESSFEKQIQETRSSVAIPSTKGMGIGPGNTYNENRVRTDRFITPHQTSNPQNNFLNYSNISSSSYTYPEPITRPIWRESVNIRKETNHMVDGVYEGAFQFQPSPHHQFQYPPFHQFQQPPFHQFQQPPPLDTNMLPESDVDPNFVEPKLPISKTRMKKLRKKMRMSSPNAELESEFKKAKEEFYKSISKKNKKKCKEPKGKCFYCGVDGHWKRNCTKYLAQL